jgi:hypothetical protein
MSGMISYTLAERDIVAQGHAQYLRHAMSKRALGQNGLTFAILWLIVFAMDFAARGSPAASALSATTFCAAVVPIAAMLGVIGYFLAGYRARRVFRQQRTLREEYQVTWTDQDLEVRTPSVAASMPWLDYHGWQLEAVGFLIYISDYYWYALPRRAFSDDQWNDLRETLVRSGLRQIGNVAEAASPARLPGPKANPVARPWWRGPWSHPGRVALLWIALTAIVTTDAVVFPDATFNMVSRTLFLSGTPILAALLAGWALRLRWSTFGLAVMLLATAIFFESAWFVSKIVAAVAGWDEQYFWPLAAMTIAFMVASLWLRFSSRGKARCLTAIALILGTIATAAGFIQGDVLFWRASSEARALLHLGSEDEGEADADAMPDITPDRLWGEQQRLVDTAVASLPSRAPAQANVYAIAVSAAGTQQLFSREARLALRITTARFGNGYRGGILLSNGIADILRTPLATQGNMAASARGIAERIDPVSDVTIVYLASHGSPDAELSTNLPSYDELTPISAASVADAMAQAGIKRRVIIVSACYSGSWIPALANDDTIIITAARKDRTSFGCDDARRLTFFGQAFLEGPLARGASLRDAFDHARTTVARWEAKDHLTPSEPQAYVGRNMRAIWTEQRSPKS